MPRSHRPEIGRHRWRSLGRLPWKRSSGCKPVRGPAAPDRSHLTDGAVQAASCRSAFAVRLRGRIGSLPNKSGETILLPFPHCVCPPPQFSGRADGCGRESAARSRWFDSKRFRTRGTSARVDFLEKRKRAKSSAGTLWSEGSDRCTREPFGCSQLAAGVVPRRRAKPPTESVETLAT